MAEARSFFEQAGKPVKNGGPGTFGQKRYVVDPKVLGQHVKDGTNRYLSVLM
jgi:hypothetical protein